MSRRTALLQEQMPAMRAVYHCHANSNHPLGSLDPLASAEAVKGLIPISGCRLVERKAMFGASHASSNGALQDRLYVKC